MSPVMPSGGAQLLVTWLVIAVLFAAPIGAWVLRKRLADATGAARVFRDALHLVAIATSPFWVLALVWTLVSAVLLVREFAEYIAQSW